MEVFAIPSTALVVLVGAAGAGKSTFARAHFRPTEILSSDFFRGLVSDDEGDQEASADAFDLLHQVLEKRLRRGKLTVVDATNVQSAPRARLLARAGRYQRPAVAIVFDTPEDLAVERAAARAERVVQPAVVRRQFAELPRSEDLLRQGFAKVLRLAPAASVSIRRLDPDPAGKLNV